MGKDRISWEFLRIEALVLGVLFPLDKGKEMGKESGMIGGLGP